LLGACKEEKGATGKEKVFHDEKFLQK
jgi:hypothetical protein